MKSFALISLIVLFCSTVGAQNTTNISRIDETNAMSVEVVKFYNAGKFDEALPLAKQVVLIREEKAGKTHISLAPALKNLAYIQLKLDDRKGAEKTFNRTLDILEGNQPLTGSNEEMLAEMLEAAAIFDVGDGTISKSTDRLERAIALREKINGKDSVKTAGAVEILGRIYYGRGQYEKAVPLLLRAFDIKRQIKNGVDLMLQQTASCALTKLGRTDEADKIGRSYEAPDRILIVKDQGKIISGGVINGKALYLAKPAYPAEARQNRLTGTVNVKVLIDETGKVIFACGYTGPKTLQNASEFSAYQSKFSTTTLEGRPVKVAGIITYNFTL